MSDTELLSVFLRTGTSGQNVSQMAQSLLDRFGGLGGLMRADADALLGCQGIGLARCAGLKAAFEMARRSVEGDLRRRDALSDPDMTRQFLSLKLQSLDRYRTFHEPGNVVKDRHPEQH